MAGFPIRPSRSALGPTKLDRRVVRDHARESGATEINLAWWLLAGSAGVVPQAWLYATQTGTDIPVIVARQEAWNPRRDQAAPTMARTSAGLYVVTYAASYPDETGTSQTTQLYGGAPTPQSLSDLRGTALVSSSRIVTVSIFNAGGAATDSGFMLTVW